MHDHFAQSAVMLNDITKPIAAYSKALEINPNYGNWEDSPKISGRTLHTKLIKPGRDGGVFTFYASGTAGLGRYYGN